MSLLISWLRLLASSRRPKAPAAGARRTGALLLRLSCVALLAWIGYIHLHLWLEGYRQIPTDGPLFLVDALAAFAAGIALLAWPRPLAGLLAAGYAASTLGALLMSLSVGLFGFRESISASFVTESLAIESIAVLALLAWTVLVAAGAQHPQRWRGAATTGSPVVMAGRSARPRVSAPGDGHSRPGPGKR